MEKILNYNSNLLKSILLLVLAVSGNFVGNTLGCKTQFNMTNNMFIKHILLIFIVFFTLNFSANENENPFTQIFRALMIWIFYLLFTKQNIIFTSISAGMIVLIYMLDTFSTYYKNKSYDNNLTKLTKDEHIKKYQTINIIRDYSFKIVLLIILIGFSLYLREKYIEYGSDFKFITFIFGKPNCKSLST